MAQDAPPHARRHRARRSAGFRRGRALSQRRARSGRLRGLRLVRAWRITREIYRQHALSGEGAARVGNRWNSRGMRIAYTSTSRPLAVLEMLVHVTRDTIPENLLILPINVPDTLVHEAEGFPRDSNALPYCASARRF